MEKSKSDINLKPQSFAGMLYVFIEDFKIHLVLITYLFTALNIDQTVKLNYNLSVLSL